MVVISSHWDITRCLCCFSDKIVDGMVWNRNQNTIQPFLCSDIYIKLCLHFSIISGHWDGVDGWNCFSWKTGNDYLVDTMTTGDPAKYSVHSNKKVKCPCIVMNNKHNRMSHRNYAYLENNVTLNGNRQAHAIQTLNVVINPFSNTAQRWANE